MNRLINLMWLAFILVGCGGGSSTSAAIATAVASQPSPAASQAGPLALLTAPDTLDRSTAIAGPDANADGVRDDINRWIDDQALSDPQKRAVMQMARTMQQTMLVDSTDKPAARATAERDFVAIRCVYAAFERGSDKPSQLVSRVESMTANTKERTMQYIKYNAALGGMAFDMPDKPACD